MGAESNSYFTPITRGHTVGTLCFWCKHDIQNCGYWGGDTMVAQIGSMDTDNGHGGWSFMCGQMENEHRDWMWLSSYGWGGWDEDHINEGDASSWHFYAILFEKAWEDWTLATTYMDDHYGNTQYIQNHLDAPIIALGNAVMNFDNGGTFRSEFSYMYGWYTGLRLYNRILTENELNQLAAEHPLNN